VTEPARRPLQLLGAELLGDAVGRIRAAWPRRPVVGWATVELDRAERELESAAAVDLPDDPLLGAACRRITRPDGTELVLLEPRTEGPLAGALARHGEGPLALYLVAGAGTPDDAGTAGYPLSAPAAGPLGPERRVLLGPRDGPFLLLVTP
jgi:hypothetical protein